MIRLHRRRVRSLAFALCALAACSDPLVFDSFDPHPDLVEPEPPAPALPRLSINEVMARNQSTVMAYGADGDSTFPDWIELYSDEPQPLDLGRVTLRDSAGNTWTGAGVIEPGAHLLLWADPAQPGQVPFALASAGEELTLAVDGQVVDRLATGQMEPDMAWARFPDGGPFSLTTRATPGFTNGVRPSATIDPTDVLFQRERLRDFHIYLPQSSWDALEASPYDQVHGALAFQSAYFGDVGARLKGRIGSLRGLDQKAAFKVDLNDYRPGQGVRGLDRLTFNSMVQDPSYVHEYLAYTIFRAAGVPAPRTAWVRLHVNDDYFGLYLLVESVDNEFLARWYADPTGHLFEGAYGVDFSLPRIDEFEYDQGPDPTDRSDLIEVAVVLDGPPTDAAIAELRTMVDVDEFLTYMAVETLTLHWDGYTTSNNYRVYHDPSTDLFQFIPWGTDQTFVDYWFYPYQGNGRLFLFCMQNPGCRAEYSQALRRVADLVDELDLLPVVDELEGYLMAEIVADPRRERSLGTVAAVLDATRATLRTWPEQVRGLIEL